MRAHVRPSPQFPEAVWAGEEIRLRLSAGQAADVARVLGIGTGLPLGMELPEVGVQASVSGEVNGVAMVQLPARDALRLVTLLEEADRVARHHRL
ncbi:hypothetical protein [Streptomyces sp. NPDC015680]|uniref:hypothetical protein n=1 Tax=Streptomyces sp. NPDC015680 TaxID=3364962 RepID=UPI00370147C0